MQTCQDFRSAKTKTNVGVQTFGDILNTWDFANIRGISQRKSCWDTEVSFGIAKSFSSSSGIFISHFDSGCA